MLGGKVLKVGNRGIQCCIERNCVLYKEELRVLLTEIECCIDGN